MLSLKNPFIFAPIKTGYGNAEGFVTEKHLSFYKERAKYLGAAIPEPFYMDKGLRELPTQMGIDSDEKIDCIFWEFGVSISILGTRSKSSICIPMYTN